jgi:hypothetical protein
MVRWPRKGVVPDVAAQRRAARLRWKARKREREAAELAAERRYETDFRHRRAAMANCLARHVTRRVGDPGRAIDYRLKPHLVRSAF